MDILRAIQSGDPITKSYEKKDADLLKFFLKFGYDIRKDAGLVWIFACKENDIELVKLLLSRGVPVNYMNGVALRIANIKGFSDMRKFLKDNGALSRIMR